MQAPARAPAPRTLEFYPADAGGKTLAVEEQGLAKSKIKRLYLIPILSKALATLLGRKEFDAAVLAGSAFNIGRWSNSKCVH